MKLQMKGPTGILVIPSPFPFVLCSGNPVVPWGSPPPPPPPKPPGWGELALQWKVTFLAPPPSSWPITPEVPVGQLPWAQILPWRTPVGFMFTQIGPAVDCKKKARISNSFVWLEFGCQV